jgi:lipopolysaccharide/colanic/teichoic acid biosynthesis glycosyltransferase
MSLVGPRPFPDYHLAQFTPEFRELRERVRPGVTGQWQISVRSEGPLEKQESLDTYYIRNWSLWLDIYILARTAGAVLGGRGAY